MTTLFPKNFSQYAEEEGEDIHIKWNESKFTLLCNLETEGTLAHFSRSPKHDKVNKTYYLKAQDFNFSSLPEQITGIELILKTDRKGRITDDTIQLLINDQPVGDNKSNLNLDPIKTYGGSNDLWGLENLNGNEITNTFGVLMRFRSHPHFPHRDGMYIRSIELRIH